MLKHKIGDTVLFGKRRGYVVGFTTIARRGNSDYFTYLVVELDPESASYLEPGHNGYGEHDCFISMVLVAPENTD